MYTFRFLCLYSDLFSLGWLSLFRHEVLFCFASGSELPLLTVDVLCADEVSAPD